MTMSVINTSKGLVHQLNSFSPDSYNSKEQALVAQVARALISKDHDFIKDGVVAGRIDPNMQFEFSKELFVQLSVQRGLEFSQLDSKLHELRLPFFEQLQSALEEVNDPELLNGFTFFSEIISLFKAIIELHAKNNISLECKKEELTSLYTQLYNIGFDGTSFIEENEVSLAFLVSMSADLDLYNFLITHGSEPVDDPTTEELRRIIEEFSDTLKS